MTKNFPDFDNMSPSEFERYLPQIFEDGDGHVSQDPRLQTFLGRHPDCAALVRDLEAIADQARSLFELSDPSDAVWDKIKTEIDRPATEDDDPVRNHTA
jgi:hypothetical protein